MSAKHKKSVNLIVNGEFTKGLLGWNTNDRVKGVDGRAQFDSAGSLSQSLELTSSGVVTVKFDVSHYYGNGQVKLSNSSTRYEIRGAGHYEVDFTVAVIQKVSVALEFSSSSSFDLDNVELYLEAPTECTPEQLVVNGGFDKSSLVGWATNGRVKGVDNSAQFENYGHLSQVLAVKPGVPVQVKFKAFNLYGPGTVRIAEYGRTVTFRDAGSFEVTFSAPEGVETAMLSLEFESNQGSFHLDDIEAWACPGTTKAAKISGLSPAPILLPIEPTR